MNVCIRMGLCCLLLSLGCQRSGTFATVNYNRQSSNDSNACQLESATTYSSSTALSSEILAGKYAWNSSGELITGTYVAPTFSSLMASGLHRDTGGTPTQWSILDEKTASLPAGYREVPDITIDDEGFTGVSITYATRPSTPCGTSGSITDRIDDCAGKNPGSSTWEGSTDGNAAEGTWKLVTLTATSTEVWRDERTGLVWSDQLGTANWCVAAGNVQSNDPSNYCNNGTYQNQATPTSVCAEAAGLASAVGGEDYTTGTYGDAKGGLGALNVDAPVRWRLPTSYDWKLADINGVRRVLPNMNPGSNFWSATINSNNRTIAQVFTGTTGAISSSTRTSAFNYVRCVGRVID